MIVYGKKCFWVIECHVSLKFRLLPLCKNCALWVQSCDSENQFFWHKIVGCHGMKWTQWWKCENTWMSLRKKIIILVEGNLRWLLDTTLRHWVTMLKRNRQPEQSYTDMQQEVMWCLNTLKVSNFKQFEPVIFITEDSLFLSTSHSKTVACVLTKSLFPIWQRRRRRRGKKQPCD